MKLNSPDGYDHFEMILSPTKHPIAYAAKFKEVKRIPGFSDADARKFMLEPVEMEFYYEPDVGLMAVESEVTDNIPIYSPYTGVKYDKADE